MQKKYKLAAAIVGTIVGTLLGVLILQRLYEITQSPSPPAEEQPDDTSASQPVEAGSEVTAPPEAALPIAIITKAMRDAPLQKKDFLVGSGRIVNEGSHVTFHIMVKLTNGKVAMDSKKDGNPWKGVVGDGSLITGIDQLIRGMYPGGKRAMWIPAHLAYGGNGINGQIPPNSRLYAEVELLTVF